LRLGLPGVLGLPAVASDTKEFWNTKTPSDWTAAEIQQLLTKSPWAKEGSINDTARRGGLSSAPAGAGDRRRGRAATSVGGATAPIGLQMKWGATIRWDSALPVREALHMGVPGEISTRLHPQRLRRGPRCRIGFHLRDPQGSDEPGAQRGSDRSEQNRVGAEKRIVGGWNAVLLFPPSRTESDRRGRHLQY